MITPKAFQHLLTASIHLDYAYSESEDSEIRNFRQDYFQFLLEQTEGLIVIYDEQPWIGKRNQIIYHIKQHKKNNLMDYLFDVTTSDDCAILTNEQLELVEEIEMENLYENNGHYTSNNDHIQELFYK